VPGRVDDVLAALRAGRTENGWHGPPCWARCAGLLPAGRAQTRRAPTRPRSWTTSHLGAVVCAGTWPAAASPRGRDGSLGPWRSRAPDGGHPRWWRRSRRCATRTSTGAHRVRVAALVRSCGLALFARRLPRGPDPPHPDSARPGDGACRGGWRSSPPPLAAPRLLWWTTAALPHQSTQLLQRRPEMPARTMELRPDQRRWHLGDGWTWRRSAVRGRGVPRLQLRTRSSSSARSTRWAP
jgi:hypothetical protein